ncbi:Poly [ADP-ribose] polymerase [Pseudolycoriella hygida]|uniref:Poly [ADP-ribose] polymerase n=1 Tax=Pseudolycoriella hygida TaxID=35572 RepID=A0A9Q0S1P8_9DIPT|nr:Poly [ADP-ribose] polymerase [Pseudolycoriella hygida]
MESSLSEKIKSESGSDGCLPSATAHAIKLQLNSLDKAKNYFWTIIKEKTLHSFDGESYLNDPRGCYTLSVDCLNARFARLPKSVENLLNLLFDINFAKRTIEELNVDTTKMCLERFSVKQIIDAMMVIEEIWHRINRGEAYERFVDLSKSYYHLIPYKEQTTIICTYDQVTAEVRNLKGLFAIVQSYHLIRDVINKKMSIIDRYYRLNTEIIPMARADYEFKLLEEYAKITNYQPNDDYKLEIDEIFKLSRNGEDERFERFKCFRNRYLLWHGSFLSNFASILCHGLKIAPQEVPRLGKKFGKGIYFADMISKSTKFCVTGKDNCRTGLILLCEVAIGDSDECTETIANSSATYLYELPKNKHSVKRIGKIYPNPDDHCTLSDGVIVPKGQPIVRDNNELSLNYNEYVVYKKAQVRLRYLLKIDFIRKK